MVLENEVVDVVDDEVGSAPLPKAKGGGGSSSKRKSEIWGTKVTRGSSNAFYSSVFFAKVVKKHYFPSLAILDHAMRLYVNIHKIGASTLRQKK